MITVNQIRKGYILTHKDIMFKVTNIERSKPSKRGSCVVVNGVVLEDGRKINLTLDGNNKIQKVFTTLDTFYFIYQEGDDLYFNNENEEVILSSKLLDKHELSFLPYCHEVNLLRNDDGKVLDIQLPPNLKIKISHTVNNVDKPFKEGTMENGYTIQIPAYIKQGDTIIFSLETMKFMGK